MWLSGKKLSVDGLSGSAGRVSYRQVDVSDVGQVNRLIAAIREEYGQLNGILHSAGMIADNFILKKTSTEFNQVLAPKVTGTCNLDQASRDVEMAVEWFPLEEEAWQTATKNKKAKAK